MICVLTNNVYSDYTIVLLFETDFDVKKALERAKEIYISLSKDEEAKQKIENNGYTYDDNIIKCIANIMCKEYGLKIIEYNEENMADYMRICEMFE